MPKLLDYLNQRHLSPLATHSPMPSHNQRHPAAATCFLPPTPTRYNPRPNLRRSASICPQTPVPNHHAPARRRPPTCAATESSKLWSQVRAAVPLSRAFADHMGLDALQRISEQKYKVVCPFHNDKNPSLHINDDLGFFHCFGCGASGSIIDLEQRIAGHRSIPKALQSLVGKYPPIASVLGPSAHFIHAADDDAPSSPLPAVRPRPKISHRVRITHEAIAKDVLRETALLYQRVLWSAAHPQALAYLTDDRGLSAPTLRAFACGFAPAHPSSSFLLSALAETHPPDNIVLAGLARPTRTQSDRSAHYDIFRNRVVTPIRDAHGNTLAFAGRVLPGAPPRDAKYINGPETVIFKKQNVLFGADLAKRAPTATADDGYVLILEGYLDVMSLFDRTQGRVACVAAMGSAISAWQIRSAYALLKDGVDGRVIINLDNDEAGLKSVTRLCDSVIPLLNDCAHAVFIAVPPPGVKDVDEFVNGIGAAEEYVLYVLETSIPWYQWRSDGIIQEELARLDRLDKNNIVEAPPGFDEGAVMEEGDFDFVIADYLKSQCDDMLVAFGAPADSLASSGVKKHVVTQCSPKVLDQLADILVSAHRCLPGLNIAALVQSWADMLSRSEPAYLMTIYKGLLSRAEKKSRPWRHLTAQAQVYWMPPAPWVVKELPASKRKKVNSAAGFNAEGETMDLDTYMSDSKRVARSMAKLDHQEKTFIPIVEQQQSERVKRLKLAPRRSAEEIILRALIFANEKDRCDALVAVSEVMVRSAEKGLPFWTSENRQLLFEYLAVQLEGANSPDEMAAYLEEFDWFSPEIEDLFMPLEEETDQEWKSIRELENLYPVRVALSTANSVDVMAGKVASRLALSNFGSVMEQMKAIDDEAGSDSSGDGGYEKDIHDEETRRLLAEQKVLQAKIDQSQYLSPQELEKRDASFAERAEELDLAQKREWFLKKLGKNEYIPPPDWMSQDESQED